MVVSVSGPLLFVGLLEVASAGFVSSLIRTTAPAELLERASVVSRALLSTALLSPTSTVIAVETGSALVLRFEEDEVLLSHQLGFRNARGGRFIVEVPFVLLLETTERGLLVVIEEVLAKPVRFDLTNATEFRSLLELDIK